jgi:hypothetical protein
VRSFNHLNNPTTRIDLLKQRERDIRAALAAEQMKLAKRRQRDTERLERIIGGAVVKAAAVFPQFKAVIAQTALREVDGKTREFLTARGWEI